MCCPVSGCSHSFTTKKWFTTNTSIKRHLTSFHRRPNLFVQYWCSSCRKRIVQPARHRCLKGASLVTRSSQGTWECEDCQFKASTKVGLDNHRKTHRREAAVLELPQLTVPETSSKKAKKKKARMAPLSSGDPGSARLAPPASPLAADPRVLIKTKMLLRVALTWPFLRYSRALSKHSTLCWRWMRSVAHCHTSRRLLTTWLWWCKNTSTCPVLHKTKTQQRQTARRTSRTLKQCSAIIDGTDVWEHAKTDVIEQSQNPPTRPPVVEALAREFVLECLKSCENTAPGPDLISYKHWREVDPNCVVLTKLFNVCLKLADVPKRWKLSNTILIQKKNEPASITDWRPISLSDTAYKLFSKCLARKLSDWCETFEVMSPAQKGFSPFDGVIEHNFLLSEHLEAARRDKCERFVAWLDIANAFGSIPHGVILSALRNCGVDQDFARLVQNIYTEAATQVLTNDGPTLPIHLRSGVKQGCPLSGILFNLSIDVVLQEVQSDQESRAILAFADDIVLLAKSQVDLQALLDKACARLQDLKLEKNFSDANEALRLADCIAKSHLAQWQKLDALKTFFFPSLSFAMRTDQLDKTAWSEVTNLSVVRLKTSSPCHKMLQPLPFCKQEKGWLLRPSAAEDSDFLLGRYCL
ncbi:retrovirus-related Pol polyprotein from type-1 retrotransposable element R2 [Trichonephila clavata]|uniref:Retrovirus-related Pol polyprotein from type-1 retrotransposable element R2 n=1 Tax=Trichonephila clavata TaxID=2740835 RepID=A0A8X6IFG1_TRICU|nr:retrovirus-related Pol polyprotein from type-1 retrotransposable element R2 [Trichonephila clavata]